MVSFGCRDEGEIRRTPKGAQTVGEVLGTGDNMRFREFWEAFLMMRKMWRKNVEYQAKETVMEVFCEEVSCLSYC